MLPKNILFVLFISFIPGAYSANGTYVQCAVDSCRQRAMELLQHPYPPIERCNEPLGNEDCKNYRQKNYYECDVCKAITIKNTVVHRDDPEPPCTHKGKMLFLGPRVPPPSQAPSQPSSSAGVTPSRTIGKTTYFMFLPEEPPSP
ncbi:hypothetical protein PGT21_021315 [Puccinia graminis f. sp. tritici]|uniref:Uncharacterized protein n=1 Tax=Puccinia graminis f. sp. tritici TaxID=56615 RepID=A0A5B0NNP0_PUCGR|nr:hypothetical protein PGT21_021315 [Puccinia graminis f. sp. tritici]